MGEPISRRGRFKIGRIIGTWWQSIKQQKLPLADRMFGIKCQLTLAFHTNTLGRRLLTLHGIFKALRHESCSKNVKLEK